MVVPKKKKKKKKKKKAPHAERIFQLPLLLKLHQIQRSQLGGHIFKEPLIFKKNSSVDVHSQTVQWHCKDSCRAIGFSGSHLHASACSWWKDETSTDLGIGLAQPLSSHSLVNKTVNCLKYNLIHWFIDSFTGQTSVEQILHANPRMGKHTRRGRAPCSQKLIS